MEIKVNIILSKQSDNEKLPVFLEHYAFIEWVKQYSCRISNYSKGQVNFRMTFGRLHLSQKTYKNISVFLLYLSKIDQIKKRQKIIILQDK